MTVCIAARCGMGDSFISVSDQMLSYSNFTSADGLAIKKWPVGTRWQAMFSADNVAAVPAIMRRVWRYCQDTPRQSIEDMMGAFERGYREEREAIVNATILSKLKLDLETYQQQGYERLGPEIHQDIYRKIQELEVSATFLVYGFDADGEARIFRVDDPGYAQSLDVEGFGVIGSGWPLAQASLLSRPLPIRSAAELVYRLCEAKFVAEHAPGVGRDTVVAQLHRPAEPAAPESVAEDKYLSAEDVERSIRFNWEIEQKKTLSIYVVSAIEEALSKALAPLSIAKKIETVMQSDVQKSKLA